MGTVSPHAFLRTRPARGTCSFTRIEGAGIQKSEGSVTVPFVDLGPSHAVVGDEIAADLARLIERGVFVNGPDVEAFEQAFAAACGLEEGDEVIVPAMTFIATFEAVVQAGGRPVVADVQDDDAGLDPAAAAAVVSPRTRFLLPVHLYGQMADVRSLGELADRTGIELLEDACQAHGAERDGVRAGGAGTAAAFSFYPSKNLGAMGDAGALVLDDDDHLRKARALREHGQTSRYRSEYVGYTARLDAFQAVVLLRKLPLLGRWNEERRAAAAFYREALWGVGDLKLPLAVHGAKHVWHVYAVRTADPAGLAAFLGARGISTSRHYPEPPHLAAAFSGLGRRAGAFPVAEAIARETISLPMFPGITEEQLEAVAEAIRDFFARGS